MSKAATCDERTTRTDVFRAFLVQGAQYDGEIELPVIRTSPLLPNRVIPFTKALSTDDCDQWVVIYECDDKLARLWNNPARYLERLKKFNGVVSPDFSLYRNMPLVMGRR